ISNTQHDNYNTQFTHRGNLRHSSSYKVTHNAVDKLVHNHVNNMEGFPFKSQFAKSPLLYRILATAAIIAALSVHNVIGGISICSSLSLNRSSTPARKPELAATPPAIIS